MKNKLKKYILITLIGIVVFFMTRAIVSYLFINTKIQSINFIVYSFWQCRERMGSTLFYFVLMILVIIAVGLIYLASKKIKKLILDIKEHKYKYIFVFRPLLNAIIALIITAGISLGLYALFKVFIYYLGSNIIYSLYVIIGYFYIDKTFEIVLFIGIYYWLNKKRAHRFQNLLKISTDMADGEEESIIKDKEKDEISKISNNVDKIFINLKNKVDEERKAQKTKNDLITNISHDLRTPLTSIIGYLEVIERDQYKDEVELRYYTDIAYRKSKSLNVLINDLFELTKMQNYQVELDLKTINLNELLGQIAAEYMYISKSNDVEIRLKTSEHKIMINADSAKLVRVFENLITNSIKYGKDGHYIDIVESKDDKNVIIQVINYGEEIPESELPYIFDRFYREDKARNTKEGSSGLGLSIAKNIVLLHKGSINAYSSVEKTVFEIKLPLDKLDGDV